MALNLGPLNVLLRLQGADKFKRDTQQATSGVAKLGKAIGGLIAIQQVSQQFVEATQVFAEFERGMVRVGAVTNSLGTKAFAGLTDRAQDLAKTTEFTARQVADAMGFMGMAGMKTNQIFEATPAVLQLASAGMVDVASAADTVTNIMAGYGLKTEDLNNANNVLVATFTNSNTSLQQLGQSFKYVGPVAKSAGVQFKEAAAVIGLMGNAGLQADMAGTALRGAILKLLDPTAEGARIIRQYGINVKDSNGKLKSMTEIFKQLAPVAEDGAKMNALFGERAGPGMQAAIAQGTNALESLINKIDNAGNIAERIAKAQMETLDGKIKIMKSNFEALQIAIGDALGSKTAKLVGFLANRFDDLAWSIKKVTKGLSDPVAQAAQSEAEIRRQQNAIRQREIGRMLQTGFYRASYPMGHPLAGAQVSPTMLQAQGATAGMMAGTEPGRLAGVTDAQRVALQAELNRLREEEKKLIEGEVKAREEKEKKDKAETGKSKRTRTFVEQIEGAAGVDAVRALFDGIRDKAVMGLAEMSSKEFDAFMESFEPEVIIDHSEAIRRATKSAIEFSNELIKVGETVLSGRAGSTFGPQLGAAAGGAIAGALSGGAATGIGSAAGSLIGGLLGDALDELVGALKVLTPIFDLFADIMKTLSPIFVIMREVIASVASVFKIILIPILGAVVDAMAPFQYTFLVLAKAFEAIIPFLSIFTSLLINVLLGPTIMFGQAVTSVLGLLKGAFDFFKGAFNGFADAINTFFDNIRNIEILGVKPFEGLGVTIPKIETEFMTLAEIMAEETGAREESTRSIREFNEELSNVPIGVKRLRSMQYTATRGVPFPGMFNQPAF